MPHPSVLICRVRLPFSKPSLRVDALYSRSHQAPKEMSHPSLLRNSAFLKAGVVPFPECVVPVSLKYPSLTTRCLQALQPGFNF